MIALTLAGHGTDRIHALRDCIRNVRTRETVSTSGVYGGFLNLFPFGAIIQKGITIRARQRNVQNYMETLIHAIEEGNIALSFVITHRCGLESGPHMYDTFKHKKDGCIKVVMRPHG